MLKGVCFESEILMGSFPYFSTKGDAGFVGKILINSLSLVVGFNGILGEKGFVVFPAPFLLFEKVPPSNGTFFMKCL